MKVSTCMFGLQCNLTRSNLHCKIDCNVSNITVKKYSCEMFSNIQFGRMNRELMVHGRHGLNRICLIGILEFFVPEPTAQSAVPGVSPGRGY